MGAGEGSGVHRVTFYVRERPDQSDITSYHAALLWAEACRDQVTNLVYVSSFRVEEVT